MLAGPVMPALAKANTPQGAAAFARHWYAELEHAYEVRDSTRLAALSDPSCRTWRNYIEDVSAARRDGRTFTGISIDILYAEAPPIEGSYCTVLVTYDQASFTVKRADGSTKRSYPGVRKTDVQFQALRKQQGWVAVRVVEPRG